LVLPSWPKPTVTIGFVYFRSQQGSIQVGTQKTRSNYGFCQLGQIPQSPWVLCISGPHKVPSKLEHQNPQQPWVLPTWPNPTVTMGFVHFRSPQGSIQVGTPKTRSNYGFCQLGQNPQSPWVLCISCPTKFPSKLEYQNPQQPWVLRTWPKPTVTMGFVHFRSPQGSILVGTPKTRSNYGFCQLGQNPQSPWVLCISGPHKVPSKLEHQKPSVTMGFANLTKTHSHHRFCAFQVPTRFHPSWNTKNPQ